MSSTVLSGVSGAATGCTSTRPPEDFIHHEVTPDSKPDIQPAGEKDGQLGVRPGSSVAGCSSSLGDANTGIQGLLKGFDVVPRVRGRHEVVQALPEVLGRLGHVEVPVFAEREGVALVFAGDECSSDKGTPA